MNSKVWMGGWISTHSSAMFQQTLTTRRHQAHSKSRPNYGQMRAGSLCLRTKPEVTQLVFKGSSHSRSSGVVQEEEEGAPRWGR